MVLFSASRLPSCLLNVWIRAWCQVFHRNNLGRLILYTNHIADVLENAAHDACLGGSGPDEPDILAMSCEPNSKTSAIHLPRSHHCRKAMLEYKDACACQCGMIGTKSAVGLAAMIRISSAMKSCSRFKTKLRNCANQQPGG
jgi:hypothetical protein